MNADDLSRAEVGACADCLARSWLLERLAGHLDRGRGRLDELLVLDNDEVIAALGGRERAAVTDELAAFAPNVARDRAHRAGVQTICRCHAAYPVGLRRLEAPPAVVHIAAGARDRLFAALAGDCVAIVGSRRPTRYGIEVAHTLGHDLARAGVPVLSGMALGVDSASHAGAIAAGGTTIAVLPAGAARAYPPAKRGLHARICEVGAAVSELPGETTIRRWMFPARNRLIAALSALTVVVEARERSGALVTARYARAVGCPVGAVPGRVTSPQAGGSNGLLVGGAMVVRNAQDVLDLLYGIGGRLVPTPVRPRLDRELEALLEAIAAGYDTAGALERAGWPPEQGLAALASLEIAGYVRREPGGRYGLTA